MKPVLLALLLVLTLGVTACDKIRLVPDTSPPTYGNFGTESGGGGDSGSAE